MPGRTASSYDVSACVLLSDPLLHADTTDNTVTRVDVTAAVSDDNQPSLLVHCGTDSSVADRSVDLLQRNSSLSNCHDNAVSGMLVKRPASDDTCHLPHKRPTMTHSSLLDTSAAGMISHRNSSMAGNTSALPAFPNVTLPSFPPTLFSCFPSQGNSHAHSCPPRAVPPVVLSTDTTRWSNTTSTSTLFSIPVHGVASGPCPVMLVPSIQNCVLVPSLGSSLLYVLNAALQSRSTSAPTTVAAAVGIPHAAGNLQPGISLLPHLLQPVGGAVSSDQSARSIPSRNPNITGNLLPLHSSMPNIPMISHPLRLVGRTSAPDQLASTGVGIPHVARNSLPLSLPLSNIPLLSHQLRPLGGSAVNQSVSCMGNMRGGRVPALSLLSNAGTSLMTQPRLNGIISPRSNALVVPGIFRPSQIVSNTFLPTLPKPLSVPYITLPRLPSTVRKIPTLPSSVLSSTNCRPNLCGHVAVAGMSDQCHQSISDSSPSLVPSALHAYLGQKSTECQKSSPGGSLSPVISLSVSTHSILRTILNQQTAAVAAADTSSSPSCLPASDTVVSASFSHLYMSSTQHDSVISSSVSSSADNAVKQP